MSKEFIINKTEGRIIKGSLDAYLDSIDDGRYKVIVEKANKRTLNQNSWFHAVLPEIQRGLYDAGYNDVKTPEDAKDVVKSLFFKKPITNGSETIEIIEKTSEKTTIEFAEKADEIIKWAFEYLGVDIAPPETQLEIYE